MATPDLPSVATSPFPVAPDMVHPMQFVPAKHEDLHRQDFSTAAVDHQMPLANPEFHENFEAMLDQIRMANTESSCKANMMALKFLAEEIEVPYQQQKDHEAAQFRDMVETNEASRAILEMNLEFIVDNCKERDDNVRSVVELMISQIERQEQRETFERLQQDKDLMEKKHKKEVKSLKKLLLKHSSIIETIYNVAGRAIVPKEKPLKTSAQEPAAKRQRRSGRK